MSVPINKLDLKRFKALTEAFSQDGVKGELRIYISKSDKPGHYCSIEMTGTLPEEVVNAVFEGEV